MENTNFSISGGACAPPHNGQLFLGRGVNIEYTDKGRVEVSKEWVKALLKEFNNHIVWDYDYEDGKPYTDSPHELEEFLEKSEVWNGK